MGPRVTIIDRFHCILFDPEQKRHLCVGMILVQSYCRDTDCYIATETTTTTSETKDMEDNSSVVRSVNITSAATDSSTVSESSADERTVELVKVAACKDSSPNFVISLQLCNCL